MCKIITITADGEEEEDHKRCVISSLFYFLTIAGVINLKMFTLRLKKFPIKFCYFLTEFLHFCSRFYGPIATVNLCEDLYSFYSFTFFVIEEILTDYLEIHNSARHTLTFCRYKHSQSWCLID